MPPISIAPHDVVGAAATHMLGSRPHPNPFRSPRSGGRGGAHVTLPGSPRATAYPAQPTEQSVASTVSQTISWRTQRALGPAPIMHVSVRGMTAYAAARRHVLNATGKDGRPDATLRSAGWETTPAAAEAASGLVVHGATTSRQLIRAGTGRARSPS